MTTYTGRKKIVIPVTVQQFNSNPVLWIKTYLSYCLTINEQNKRESLELRKIYQGDQDIKNKVRINGDKKNNNQTTINHTFRHVEFKKGFMVGNPIEYANSNSNINTDDLLYLQKYFRDSKKPSLDISKYEKLFISGVAHTFVMPRQSNFDIINQAPFILSVLEEGQGFVVYSSDITNSILFNVVISEHVNMVAGKPTKKKVFDIYYIKESDGYCYNFSLVRKGSYDFDYFEENEVQQTYKFLPIDEYCLNDSRMGCVETIISIQNFLNSTRSNQIDAIVDFVNSYLVFENQNFKSPDFLSIFNELKEKRVLGLSTNDPNKPAKVYLLKDDLKNTDINVVYDDIKNEMYDINAVPLSTGNVTSGGDTGQARLLGNGWESAQNQATTDTTYLIQFEYSLLEKLLWIAKDIDGCPIKEISASDIEIKFAINMSNNLLVKSQSLKYLYDMNMPKEEALTITGLTADTNGVANKWQNNDDKIKTENANLENQKKEDSNAE